MVCRQSYLPLLFGIFIAGCSKSTGVENVAGKPTISSADVSNNILTLNGTHLDQVNSVQITGPSVSQYFSVIQQVPTQLTASALSAIVFAMGIPYNLIISNANAATTSATLTFTIQNGVVTPAILDRAYLPLSGGGTVAGDVHVQGSVYADSGGSFTGTNLNVNSALTLTHYATAPTDAGNLVIQRMRGASPTPLPIGATDTLGTISFQGQMAGAIQTGAQIVAQAGPTASSNTSGNLIFYTRDDGQGLAEAMRITNKGQVYTTGFGGSSPPNIFISGNANGGVGIGTNTEDIVNGSVNIGVGSANGSISNHNLLVVGTASNTGNVYVNGNITAAGSVTAASATIPTLNGNVTIVGGTTTCTLGGGVGATMCTSDNRLKDKASNLSGALEKLRMIQGIYYKWKRFYSKNTDTHLGVFAQDVEKVFPELVTTDSSKDHYKMLDYAGLVVPAIEGIKELDTKVAEQENQIQAQKKKLEEKDLELTELKSRLLELEKLVPGSRANPKTN